MTSRITADVIVIGGGIHGCSAALALAQENLSVVVIEKDHVARHASGVNAGGVRTLGRHVAEIPLALASSKLWHSLPELLGDELASHCGFNPVGQIKVAESEAELEQLVARVSTLQRLGFKHEVIIGQDELRTLCPSLSRHCVGAIYVLDDGYALPFQTVQAIKARCVSWGVHIYEGERVLSVQNQNGNWLANTDKRQFASTELVNCSGAWSGEIARMVGEDVAVSARAPMLMVSERRLSFVGPVFGAAGRTLSFKQFPNGTVLIGGGYEGTAFPDSGRTVLDFSKLADSAQTACTLFPEMNGARIVRSWAGIEGYTPDGLPVLGRSEENGIIHSCGYSAHGFQLGLICGQIVRDLVVDGATSHPIEPFRPARFA